MTTDQLPNLIKSQPFLPFTIRTADGREVKVLHPESIAYKGGRIAVVLNPDESVDIIDLLLVPGINVPAPVEQSN